MSNNKHSLNGINALLAASELIKLGVTNKNWVKREPVGQEQKSSWSNVERKQETIAGTSVAGGVRGKSEHSVGQSGINRQPANRGYTCVRIRFHRLPSSGYSHKRERAQQEGEDVPIFKQSTSNQLLLQKVSKFKQRKRSRKERSIAVPPIDQVTPKPFDGERLEPRLQRTGVNRKNNMLNLASHQAVKVRSSNIEMENSNPKALTKLLDSTRLSYMIVQRSYYPQQPRENNFYSRLMCLFSDDTFECEINWADSMDITVLMLACSLPDNVKMVRDLLSSGANPFAFDVIGRCPLHYAAERGTLKVIKLLVLHSEVPVDIHGPDLNWTPLLAAVVNKRWDSVNLLSALAVATKSKP